MTSRAVLAIGLMVGFYLLALVIAGVLLFIPYAEWAYAQRLHLKIALFCVLGAGIILWSLVPRIDRFNAPGPALTAAEQPKLFEALEEVARRTNERMPAEVYLTLEVNAWVTERGGWMGLGSRRVMGLGLPLLRVLKISELQAVLAHEFGHFYGGDTKLGPWIYKTRAAIGRTLEGLSQHSEWLQFPFLAYGKMFLRVTHAISRQQEYSADALAARTVGAAPLVTALKTISAAGLAFDPYLSQEFFPLLSQGYRAPLADGFAQFLAATPISAAVDEAVQRDLAEGQVDPYDTHPPLRDRAAALGLTVDVARADQDFPALSLLANSDLLESKLLAAATTVLDADQLKVVGWQELGERVYLPNWVALVRKHQSGLQGITPASFPEWAKDLSGFGARLAEKGRLVPREELSQSALATLGSALAVALKKRGWELRAVPGEPLSFVSGDRNLIPFSVLTRLNEGVLSEGDWRRECTEIGIADVNLGSLLSAEEKSEFSE